VFIAECLLVFAQLRDVLSAEDSAIVAKENEDGGIIFPERAETDGIAKGVGERDAGEPLAEGFRHEGHHCGSGETCQERLAGRLVRLRGHPQTSFAGGVWLVQRLRFAFSILRSWRNKTLGVIPG
jgi:hypothetical protein